MRLRIAAALSIIGHPFVVVPCTVALTVRPARPAVGIALVTVIAMLAVIARQVAAGRWSDYDVSDQKQRHGFYPWALGIVAAGALVSWWARLPIGFVRAMAVAFGVIAIAAVLTRWTKVSLHALLGAFCAVIASGIDVRAAVALGVLVLLVGWSRVALKRHRVGEVVLGIVLGALGGGVIVFLG